VGPYLIRGVWFLSRFAARGNQSYLDYWVIFAFLVVNMTMEKEERTLV
jgi:hypothetical protein